MEGALLGCYNYFDFHWYHHLLDPKPYGCLPQNKNQEIDCPSCRKVICQMSQAVEDQAKSEHQEPQEPQGYEIIANWRLSCIEWLEG